MTGGLTFAGGPGNNYGTHAVASMVQALRADPGSLGLVTGLGWYLTKHSVGVYGTEPGLADRPPPAPDLPEGTDLEEAAGFAWAGPQAAVGALPQCSPDADAHGRGHRGDLLGGLRPQREPRAGRGGLPHPEGRRAWAKVTDPDHLAVLVTEEGCGRLGTLRPDGEVDLR